MPEGTALWSQGVCRSQLLDTNACASEAPWSMWHKTTRRRPHEQRCSGVLLLSLDCSTLPLIRTLDCWVLSKEALSTIFKVFGLTRPVIEPRSVHPWPGKLGFNPWFESYQRLKKWYLMPPCLTLSIIRYGSRVKWSNPGKGIAPSPTPPV